MIACILLTKFRILAIFIISLLLCIKIQSTITIDPVEENLSISRTDSTDENNQTITDSQSNDYVLSDLNSQTTPSTADNYVLAIPTENKSEIIDELSPVLASPHVIDNQTTSSTSDDPQQTAPSSPKKNLSNINSFEEWKQQQLHADLLKKGEINGHNGIPSETSSTSSSKGTSSSSNIQQLASSPGSSKKGKLRKNFASASCGAKILAHNAEAQNVPSILSSSPDEYMLNPCNAKIWFVIELCESVRVLNIEIANFELFSSVPKTFRVSASDRYPTKDWHRHHLGTFNASFNRTIQSYQTLETTTYLKYIKFELLDFHGHEHYCPLSVVRIHGSNVEDEIMTMEENTNLNDLKSLSDIQDENDNDDDDDPINDQQVGGIIGSAIIDLAKRVFRRQTIRGTPSTTTTPIIETNVIKTSCHQPVLNGSINNESIHSWRHKDTFKQCIADFLRGLWSNFDTCATYLSHVCFQSSYCCQCPVITNKSISDAAKSSLNLHINPCGYYHLLTNQFVCKKEKIVRLNETISHVSPIINSELTQEFIDKNLTSDKNDTVIINNQIANTSSNQSAVNLNSTLSQEAQLMPDRFGEQPSMNNIPDAAMLLLELLIRSNTTNQSSSQSSSPVEPVNGDFNVTEQSIDVNTTEESVTSPSPLPATLNVNYGLPPIISSPWLKGMLVNTKSLPELFKIIEKLNFNLTLSNRYLQELSQHYVKKLDETQQTTDLLLKASQAADEKLQYLEENLYKSQEDFDEISHRLVKLEAWIPLFICIIIILLFWNIWSAYRLAQLQRNLKLISKRDEPKHFEQIDNNDDEEYDNNVHPVQCNNVNRRKSSTDSTDSTISNPHRSQRVPDSSLSKIKENGIHKTEHKTRRKPSNKTRHLPPISTI